MVNFVVAESFKILRIVFILSGGKLPAINYSGKDWYPSVSDHLGYIEKWNTFGFANKK